jgi:hypothetical protein
MTDEAMQVAIAEELGWTEVDQKHGRYKWSEDGETRLPKQWHRVGADFHGLPDYLNDLNAMHEAEKGLDVALRDAYFDHLWNICDKAQRMAPVSRWLVPNATARQRAEAFLRTVERWVD